MREGEPFRVGSPVACRTTNHRTRIRIDHMDIDVFAPIEPDKKLEAIAIGRFKTKPISVGRADCAGHRVRWHIEWGRLVIGVVGFILVVTTIRLRSLFASTIKPVADLAIWTLTVEHTRAGDAQLVEGCLVEIAIDPQIILAIRRRIKVQTLSTIFSRTLCDHHTVHIKNGEIQIGLNGIGIERQLGALTFAQRKHKPVLCFRTDK